MKKSSFAFIRHGAYHQPTGVPSARLPHPLTEEGMAHSVAGAKELEALLNQHQLSLNPEIHCSTLLRAFQSASIYKEELEKLFSLEITIKQSEELCERGLGAMANLTVREIEDVLAKDPRFEDPPVGWKSSTHYKLPYHGAESLYEAGKRVADYVRENLKEDQLTLFIGHGASMRFAAVHLGLWNEEKAHAHSMFYARPVLHHYENQKMTHFAGEWKIRKPKESPKD